MRTPFQMIGNGAETVCSDGFCTMSYGDNALPGEVHPTISFDRHRSKLGNHDDCFAQAESESHDS